MNFIITKQQIEQLNAFINKGAYPSFTVEYIGAHLQMLATLPPEEKKEIEIEDE